jgi:hypothetical protein
MISMNYTLVISEKQYKDALRHIHFSPKDIEKEIWIGDSTARASFRKDKKTGRRCAIVSLNVDPKLGKIQCYSLLVHEATHIFQDYCECIGEISPSAEFEAYSIQWISQQLMYEFDRLTRKIVFIGK